MNTDEITPENLIAELEQLDLKLGDLGQLLQHDDEFLFQALKALDGDTRDLDLLQSMLIEREGEGDVDVFDVLGLQGRELFHSDFLAWLLGPKGSHGLGDRFLQGFLRLIHGRAVLPAANSPATTADREAFLTYGGVSGRLDILIRNSNAGYLCAIENKVWAPEGADQLGWYRRVLESDYPGHMVDLVFLTPDGREPEEDEERNHWTRVSYTDILRLVDEILDTEPAIENSDVAAFLRQYAVTLRRNIVPDISNDIHELAKRIYRRHTRAIDLIIENRERYAPNYVTEGFRMVREAVGHQPLFSEGTCNRPYARFRSVAWDDYDELRLDYWPNSLLLFEVQVTDRSASLYLTLCRGGDESLRQRIFERVKENGDVFNCEATVYTDQYIVLHQEGDILEESDYEVWWDEDTVRGRLRSRLDEFARGAFPKLNQVILNALEERRSESA